MAKNHRHYNDRCCDMYSKKPEDDDTERILPKCYRKRCGANKEHESKNKYIKNKFYKHSYNSRKKSNKSITKVVATLSKMRISNSNMDLSSCLSIISDSPIQSDPKDISYEDISLDSLVCSSDEEFSKFMKEPTKGIQHCSTPINATETSSPGSEMH